jgi:hypothetical protein
VSRTENDSAAQELTPIFLKARIGKVTILLSTFDGAFIFTKKRLLRLPRATEMSISIPMLWRC